jgi:hypothetical protein
MDHQPTRSDRGQRCISGHPDHRLRANTDGDERRQHEGAQRGSRAGIRPRHEAGPITDPVLHTCHAQPRQRRGHPPTDGVHMGHRGASSTPGSYSHKQLLLTPDKHRQTPMETRSREVGRGVKHPFCPNTQTRGCRPGLGWP